MQNGPINVGEIKGLNRNNALRLVRTSPISRAGIAKATGLTRAAVTNIVHSLLQEGVVREIGLGEPGKGKQPMMLALNPSHRYGIGLLVIREKFAVCLTDLCGKLLDSIEVRPVPDSLQKALDCILYLVEELLERNRIPLKSIAGIGIGVPGPVDHYLGKLLTPPNFDFLHNTPLAAILSEELGVPAFLENDVVAYGLLEYAMSDIKAYKKILALYVSDYVGGVVLENGRVARGANGSAGEFGHMSVNPDGPKCSCGNRGCLEMYASMRSLRRRFSGRWDGDWAKLAASLQDGGDGVGREVYACAFKYLSTGLLNLVNAFDVDAVVLFGDVTYWAERLCGDLEEYIHQNKIFRKGGRIPVFSSQMTPTSQVHACAGIALEEFFDAFV